MYSPDINEKVTLLFEKYSDVVRRICFMYIKSNADSEDILQEVFIKLIQTNKQFESDEHEKAWLIRVTINRCKNFNMSFWRRNVGSFDEDTPEPSTEFETKNNDILNLVLSLPPKYKDIIYLFYYEGYTAPQIAKILNKNENTIYSGLHRARLILKEKIGGDAHEYF